MATQARGLPDGGVRVRVSSLGPIGFSVSLFLPPFLIPGGDDVGIIGICGIRVIDVSALGFSFAEYEEYA